MLGHTIWVGRNHTEESKKKISLSLIGRKYKPRISENNRSKDNSNKSHKHTEESKRKISEAKKGIAKIRIECPHCKKEISPHLANRYHFNSCKMININ